MQLETPRPYADIYQEFVANTVPNSHIVVAGIVAVNRAQERGYTFAYTDACENATGLLGEGADADSSAPLRVDAVYYSRPVPVAER